MLLILLLLSALYAAALIWMAADLRLKSTSSTESSRLLVSVIVAARNESTNIENLLQALFLQDMPGDHYEVIIVDDASHDDTVHLIQNFIQTHPQRTFKLLHSRERDQVLSPKKHALAQGIAAARGEILLFTDADCMPPASWVHTMLSHFDASTGMVIGFSPYEVPPPRTFFHRLVALESLALAALAAATTARGRPATCSGRNLAYRKQVYADVGGFAAIAHFVSGDDDLFLKLVHERSGWQIRYALDPQTIVPTRHLSGFKAFVRQRLRHASKGFHYGWRMTGTLMLVYLFNLMMFTSLVLSFSITSRALWPWLALLLKSGGELFLVSRFARPMKRVHYLAVFPIAELLHIVYVLVIGAWGPLSKIRWKEKHMTQVARVAP